MGAREVLVRAMPGLYAVASAYSMKVYGTTFDKLVEQDPDRAQSLLYRILGPKAKYYAGVIARAARSSSRLNLRRKRIVHAGNMEDRIHAVAMPG